MRRRESSPAMAAAGVILLLVRGSACAAPPDEDVNPRRPAAAGVGDVICGPRCVRFLLQHYGKGDEDLVDLVKECQWPDFEAGATLGSLERALQRRGIETLALRVAPDAPLRWPHPVLLHLKGGSTGGHYAVWLPSGSPSEATVWMGIDGVRAGPWAKLAPHRTDVVLLTSPSPIVNPEAAVARSMGPLPFVLWGASAVVLAALVVSARRRRRLARVADLAGS